MVQHQEPQDREDQARSVHYNLSKEQLSGLLPYVHGLTGEEGRAASGSDPQSQVLFTGIKEVSLDAKARLIIPKYIRDANPEGVFALLRAPEQCLWLMTMYEFRRIAIDLMRASHTDAGAQQLKSLFFYHSQSSLQPDAVGRIMLPKGLRESVGLGAAGQQLILAGCGNLVEIWTPEAFADYHRGLASQ